MLDTVRILLICSKPRLNLNEPTKNLLQHWHAQLCCSRTDVARFLAIPRSSAQHRSVLKCCIAMRDQLTIEEQEGLNNAIAHEYRSKPVVFQTSVSVH